MISYVTIDKSATARAIQSRTQSPQALWPAVGSQGRLFDHRNPGAIKFQYPKVSPGDQPPAKEPEDAGYEIARH